MTEFSNLMVNAIIETYFIKQLEKIWEQRGKIRRVVAYSKMNTGNFNLIHQNLIRRSLKAT